MLARFFRNPVLKVAALYSDIQDKQPYLQYYKGNDVSKFAPGLLYTSISLGWNFDWLPRIIMHESSMNPASVNTESNATGLINFMPFIATELGTSVDALKNMTGTEQLKYVKKYYQGLQKTHGIPKSLADAYMLTFYPVAVNQPDSFKLSNAAWSENQELDKDKKGYLTVGDIRKLTNTF